MNAAQNSKPELHAEDETSKCPLNCPHENDDAVRTQTEATILSQTQLVRLLHVPALLAIGAVRLYQYLISPWLGRRCRFYPSCSQYFILSVQKFGLMRGFCKGTARICRCHPWNPGGYDPP